MSTMALAPLREALNISARAVMDRHVHCRKVKPAAHNNQDAFRCDCKYGRTLRRLLSMHRSEGL